MNADAYGFGSEGAHSNHTFQNSQHCAPSSSGTVAPARKQQRHKHSKAKWSSMRDTIVKLFIEDDKTAQEVIDILGNEHDFRVGMRKFKDWLKENDISKYAQKDEMTVLVAKRASRLAREGKQTIVYKDGRVIEDDRLDRFTERHFPGLDLSAYLPAATPKGYNYTTPKAVADSFVQDASEHWVSDVFTTIRPTQTVFGQVNDGEHGGEQDNHIHQIGVYAMRRSFKEPCQSEALAKLLHRALYLARDLLDLLVSCKMVIEITSPAYQAQKRRVLKVHTTCSGGRHNLFSNAIQNGVLHCLKNSDTVAELAQLQYSDRIRWKQDWYAMTPAEQATSARTCTNYFGSPPEYHDAMAFMHITILLASTTDPVNPVLLRISLGMDIRNYSECAVCQRRLMTLDCIEPSGAVQLNVPLSSIWKEHWEPLEVRTIEHMEQAKWCDYVYSLRGWYVPLWLYSEKYKAYLASSESGGPLQRDLTGFWDSLLDESWDPMGVNEPLSAYQPFDVAEPTSMYIASESGTVLPEETGEDSGFDPDAIDDEEWSPYDTLR